MKRIRVHIDYTHPHKTRRSWFLFDPTQCRIVSDLSYLIAQRFGLKGETYVKLELDNYSLPPSESIDLIRDNDSITVLTTSTGHDTATTSCNGEDIEEPSTAHVATPTTSVTTNFVSQWDVKSIPCMLLNDDFFLIQNAAQSDSSSSTSSTSSDEEQCVGMSGWNGKGWTKSTKLSNPNKRSRPSPHTTNTSSSSSSVTGKFGGHSTTAGSNKSLPSKPNNRGKLPNSKGKLPNSKGKLPPSRSVSTISSTKPAAAVSICKTSMSKTGAGTHIIFNDSSSSSSEERDTPLVSTQEPSPTEDGNSAPTEEKMECVSNDPPEKGSFVPFKVNGSGPAIKVGDRLKYKILELSSDYTPVFSEFKEGSVITSDPSRQSVTIELSNTTISSEAKRMEACSVGKFSLNEETVDDICVQHVVEVSIPEMIEPMIFVKESQ